MKAKRLAVVAVAAALVATAALATAYFLFLAPGPLMTRSAMGDRFVPLALPEATTQELFDIGVADIDQDDRLDIFSSNHNTRQILWVADGQGGFRDPLSAWGLDQNPSLPGAEVSDRAPEVRAPGVYIYWQGRNPLSQFPLVIRAHRLNEAARLEGTLTSYSTFGRHEAEGLTVQPSEVNATTEGELPLNSLRFAADREGTLRVVVASPGLPITVKIGEGFPLDKVFVGPQKARPGTREFAIALQDRHAFAWANLNGDSKLDVFVNRGAVGGTLRKFPAAFQATIQDELLLSQPDGRYLNAVDGSGISKRGCSGRKATWVDFDRSGTLDLFVNCMERGFVEGLYPKQLYRRTADGRFVDVAEQMGLALADHEIIDFAWVDVDNDGYPDLVTHEAKGFFIYHNDRGQRFVERFVGRGKFVRADRPQLKGTSDEYWFVDGKLTVADFDGDGFPDLFCASKMGNTLLLNDGRGGLSLEDPATRGLPAASATASWVDFDNDGRIDLFSVPQGLFRQGPDHRFSSTGLLALPQGKHMAAIANWADFDNDGRRDLVLAVLENFSQWNWWERQRRTAADRFTWELAAFRNMSGGNGWVEVQLAGGADNPQAIGARVTATTPTGSQTQVVGHNDGAFFSQGHYRLYFGLGASEQVEALRIDWPDGTRQELRGVQGNRLHLIRQPSEEGQGATK